MKSLRDALPDGLLTEMQQKLGQEETLRLLWPMVVGAELGANTRLLSIRQNRLRISVPDQTWKRTLIGMEQAVLEAVHRVCGEEVGRAIDLVEDASLSVSLAGPLIGSRMIGSRMMGSRSEKGGKGRVGSGKGKPSLPLPAVDLPDFPLLDFSLDEIHDTELRRMFGQSVKKYFARKDGAGL